MDNATLNIALDTLIRNLAKDLKDTVYRIENSHKLSMNHYSRYMGVLSSLGKGDKQKTQLIALALMRAGANSVGVRTALKNTV